MNSYLKNVSSRRARILSLACVLIIITLVLFLAPLVPPSLVVSSEGQVVYEAVIKEPVFEVSFRHSVNKGIVREVYRIDTESLMITLDEGYFQSYGAGMLDTTTITDQMNFRQEGDYFILDFPENWQRTIHYIGGNTAKHVFAYGEDSLPIGEMRPQKPFVISVSRRSLYQKLFGIFNC